MQQGKLIVNNVDLARVETQSMLRPRANGRVLRTPLTDEHLDYVASILDDFIRIPGINVRIGLDFFIGLIPVAGDMLSAVCSFIIVFAAWRRGLPKITLLRMVVNIGIDTLIGIVPVLGDCFDAIWKSNRTNYKLYIRHKESLACSLRQRRRDWWFFLLLGATMVLLALTPLLVLLLFVYILHVHGWWLW